MNAFVLVCARSLLCVVLVSAGAWAAATAAAPASPAAAATRAGSASAGAATRAALGSPSGPLQRMLAGIEARMVREPDFWNAWDLDRDRRASMWEILVCLSKDPAWLRQREPALYAHGDVNRDGLVDGEDVLALARAFDAPGVSIDFSPARRSATKLQRQAIAAGATGTTVGVQGPRYSAHVAFINQQAYIQDYDVVQGQYDPIVGVLSYGTVLQVEDWYITIYRTGPMDQSPLGH